MLVPRHRPRRRPGPAIGAGATGYLLKDAPREQLFAGIRSAAAGEPMLSPAITATLMSRVRTPVSEPLSARECEVLGLVARGGGNREIARALFISEATLKTHLVHVYEKLGVRDRGASVGAAYEQGLLGRS